MARNGQKCPEVANAQMARKKPEKPKKRPVMARNGQTWPSMAGHKWPKMANNG